MHRLLPSLTLMLACCVATTAAQPPGVRASGARISSLPPEGLRPSTALSAQDRRENFDALWKAVDTIYADFDLKSIDWNEVGRRYRARVDAVRSDDEFYTLLARMIGELRDTHSWLQNYREPPLLQVRSVAVDAFRDTAFVIAVAAGSEAARAGVQPGARILSVDGLLPNEKIEVLRPLLHGFSSERAFRREATRRLLASDAPTPATIVMRQPGGDTLTVTLQRDSGPTVHRPPAKPGFDVTRARTVEFGVHPSGIGYIHIPSFAPREELDREVDAALDALRDTPALILDIRDNAGGFSHSSIVGRFLEARTQTALAFIKSGAAHGALRAQPGYNSPTGPWRYTGRVAVLVNDATGSAADLFTTEIRRAKQVTVVGSTTHGNLSGVAAYVVLPCNLVARISNGFVADAYGRPVEVNGNAPDVVVEPTIDDFLSGRDPVMEKAVALLDGGSSSGGRQDRSRAGKHMANAPWRPVGSA